MKLLLENWRKYLNHRMSDFEALEQLLREINIKNETTT